MHTSVVGRKTQGGEGRDVQLARPRAAARGPAHTTKHVQQLAHTNSPNTCNNLHSAQGHCTPLQPTLPPRTRLPSPVFLDYHRLPRVVRLGRRRTRRRTRRQGRRQHLSQHPFPRKKRRRLSQKPKPKPWACTNVVVVRAPS